MRSNKQVFQRFIVASFIVGSLTVFGVREAVAQVSFTFVNNSLNGNAGEVTPLLYQINLQNGALESAINGLSITFDGNILPGSIIDASPFTTNLSIPDPLPSSYSDLVDFFTVNLQGVDAGVYTGLATFQYTTDGLTETPVSQAFTLTVAGNAAAPEPGTLALAVPAILGSMVLVRRKKSCTAGTP